MPLLFWVIIGVWLGLWLLSSAILSVPIDLAFNLGVPSKASPGPLLRVTWLFGLVKRDFPGARKPRRRKGQADEGKRARRRRPSIRRILNALRTRGLSGRGMTLARRVIQQFRFKELDVRMRVGTGDPADTGMLCAALWPVLYPRSAGRVNVVVEPDFLQPTFELAATGRASVIPLRLVWPLTVFLISPPTLIALRRLIRRRG
jgi:hypothetical protein